MNNNCPLCERDSIFTSVKNTIEVKCPNCNNLTFEDGTDDKMSSMLISNKREIIEKAKSMTDNQIMFFKWNKSCKNMEGDPSVMFDIISN